MRKSKVDVLMISRVYCPPAGGGVAAHVRYLAKSLSELTRSRKNPRKVCKVHVVSATAPGTRVVCEGTPPCLVLHRLPGNSFHFSPVGDVPFEAAVMYLLSNWGSIRPDLIHAHDYEAVQIGLMLKTAFNIPLILTIHRVPKEWDRTLPRRNVKDCFLQVIRKFDFLDMVIAPSNAYRQHLLDQDFPPDIVKTIYHGIPLEFLASIPDNPDALTRLDLQPDDELVLCPTRLDPHKGIDTFVEAASIVRQRLNHRRLVFAVAGAGSAAYRLRMEAQAAQCGVRDVMRFGPSGGEDFRFEDMPTVYRRAKVCVVPSRREGFGQVLVEAAIFNKPVVAANTGGIPEVLLAGQTGLLFNRDEPEDLAAQLIKVLEDEWLSRVLGERAVTRARHEFGAERMARDYLKLYRQLCGISLK